VSACDIDNAAEITGHAELVHADDGLGQRRDCRLDQFGIDVESILLDIDKDRNGTAIADGVCRGDEGMADGDDFVAGFDADGQQCKVKRRGAVGYGAGMSGADEIGEFPLESGHLRALRDPTGQNDTPDGLDLPLVENGLGNRDLAHAASPALSIFS
jgi:hypothetical protein